MTSIPRTVHRIWLQGRDQLPDHLADMCAGFDRLHPEWTQQWWDEERILDELQLGAARTIYHHAEDHVPADAVMQMRADIARYAILSRHGGLYVDVDYQWLKPIDPLLEHADAVACYEVDANWVANGFLAATRAHPLAHQALIGIPASVRTHAGKGLRANTLTGPKYLTPIVRRLSAHQRPRLLPAAYLHAVPWQRRHEADAPDLATRYPTAYAIHTWNHRRHLEQDLAESRS